MHFFMKGKFVMIDGLDGSGKGTIADALMELVESENKKILDIRSFCQEKGTFPEPEELSEYDIILSAEPSFCYVGAAIRDELIRNNDRKYSAWSLTQAFSLDREILYKRVIIPALKAGKHVIQERGVVSNIVYQPVQEHIQLNELMKLPGNKLALQFAPDLLLIAKVNPDTVMKRLKDREKKDDSIFENLLFQKQINERYNSDWLKGLFERFGSKVMYIETEGKTIEQTKDEAIQIWKDLF